MKLEHPPRARKQEREGSGRAEPAPVYDGRWLARATRWVECVQMLGKMSSSACPMCRYVASAFQRRRKTANIHADSGVI
jgi:hypothetical protein